MKMPSLPADTGTFLWGAGAGALALGIVGFSWGGWLSGGTAERLAGARAEAATLAVLTPICVAQFRRNPKAATSLKTLKETKSWEQADFVRDGGWATMPGATGEPSRDVANACAEALTKM
jgi:hypothetical protein